MIDRKYIENILRLNGSSATAPEEEIRSVLISARLDKADVDSAITVLRENVKTRENRVERVGNVFTTDKRLGPEAIHSLLGIDVKVSETEIESARVRGRNRYWLQIVSIFFIAGAIAAGSLLAIMYTQKIGIFHPSSGGF